MRSCGKSVLFLLLSALLTAMVSQAMRAAEESTTTSETATNLKGVNGVTHLAGLPDVKSNVKGALTLTPNALVFTRSDVNASIARDRITGVYVGDERTAPWGTAGRIARKGIPYGGGAVLGATTNKAVDLLTVEYRDSHQGYHGAVFVLHSKQAAGLRDQIATGLTPAAVSAPPDCTDRAARPSSVLLAPVEAHGVELPIEYRVLIYEQIIKEQQVKQPAYTYFREGDTSVSPGCAALTLQVTVQNFKKGSERWRASGGPLGLFVGTAKMSYDVKLEDTAGRTVFDAQLKTTNRSDTDSMVIARNIANDISKRIDQAMKKPDFEMTSVH